MAEWLGRRRRTRTRRRSGLLDETVGRNRSTVEPISIELLAPAVGRFLVHQVVRTRDGNLLSETNKIHTYTFSGGLIQKMEISEPSV